MLSTMAASKSIQLKDVYDSASDISQEFEKIIAITGVDDASVLINKVKNVLELLEESVHKSESFDAEYSQIKLVCDTLSNEKNLKEKEIETLKEYLEEVEESWSRESARLKSLINKLTTENKILQHQITEKTDMPFDVESSFKTIIKEQENFISRLKSSLKQKEIRHEKDQAVIESLNAEIQRLNEANRSLHDQYLIAQNTIRALRQEREESVEAANLQEEKIDRLENNFHVLKKTIAEKCEFGLQNMLDICKPLKEDYSSNREKFQVLYAEQKKLKQELKDLRMQLTLLRIQMEEYEKDIANGIEERNEKCLQTHGHLDNILQLFLGAASDNTEGCIFRNKRRHS